MRRPCYQHCSAPTCYMMQSSSCLFSLLSTVEATRTAARELHTHAAHCSCRDLCLSSGTQWLSLRCNTASKAHSLSCALALVHTRFISVIIIIYLVNMTHGVEGCRMTRRRRSACWRRPARRRRRLPGLLAWKPRPPKPAGTPCRQHLSAYT